jgi:hypothetical protein
MEEAGSGTCNEAVPETEAAMAELRPARADYLFPALEPKHCRAICQEIGDRLRKDLTGASPLPTRLRKLVDQIAELEGNSPPIMPDCEDESSPRERPKHGLRFWRLP